VIVANKEPEDYGTLCHQSIASVLRLYRFLGSLCKCYPEKRHRAVEETITPVILNASNTMRQRISSSSLNSIFFKKLENHIGAICILFIITMRFQACYHYIFTTTRWKNGYKEVDRYIVLGSRIYGNTTEKTVLPKRMRTGSASARLTWCLMMENPGNESSPDCDECPDSLLKKWLD